MKRSLLLLFTTLSSLLAQSPAPRYKAIFEPVNVKADVELYDAYFVSEQEGWVAGGAGAVSGGAILYTNDGGKTWTNQYGDFQSSDRAVRMLRFINPRMGWAVQGTGAAARLLHTSDGQNWSQTGTIAEHTSDYTFLSERHGIYIDGERIQATDDGGQHWKTVATCELTVEVNGLTQRVHCDFRALHFPTPRNGYAVGKGSPSNALFKTQDGGQTWQGVAVPGDGGVEDVFFIDANVGFMRTGYPDTGQLFRTTDGGSSFKGIGGAPGDRIRFADPSIGWAFRYGKLTYTTTGGDRWTSRSFNFPASVYGFSLPSRRRAYVIGNHGMVYRYSIVPAELNVPGAIDAPVMPGYDLPIAAEVQKLKPGIAKLKDDLDAAIKAENAGGGGAPDSGQNAAGAGNSGGFVQDPAPSNAVPDSGFIQDGTPQPFVQDTSVFDTPAGPGLATCCVMDMQNLQTSFNGFSQTVPPMVTRYRSLNLLLRVFNLFADVTNHYQTVSSSFKAMKTAPNKQAALAALTQFATQLDQMAQSAGQLIQTPPR
jgi:photosystem II stability/assembly factor-like uncharacterized protein